MDRTRALYPRPGTDIIALLRNEDAFERMRERASAFFTDDFECVFVSTLTGNRAYPGLEGLRKNWLDWLQPWTTYRTSIEELLEVGEHVVVLDRDRGRRADTDEEVEMSSATILTFRDGKVARWEFYADRAKALEAVGLAEGTHTAR